MNLFVLKMVLKVDVKIIIFIVLVFGWKIVKVKLRWKNWRNSVIRLVISRFVKSEREVVSKLLRILEFLYKYCEIK